MNTAIELHDSYLISTNKRGTTIAVRFSAYIHESEGIPGVDAGTGWTQDAILLFGDGIVEGSTSEWPADLDGGSLEIEGEVSSNIVPVPFHREGAIRLILDTKCGDRITARGNSVHLELGGVPLYIEEFPNGSTG